MLYRTLHGSLSVGDLTFLAGSFQRSRSIIEGLFSAVSNITDQALYLTDLYEFFQMQPRITKRAAALRAPRPIRTGFEFRNVSFRYPGSGRGGVAERKLPVGATGANCVDWRERGREDDDRQIDGASLTIPMKAQCCSDGVDLREYDIDLLRREVGVIFQDYMRYGARGSREYRAGEDRGSGGSGTHPAWLRTSRWPIAWVSNCRKGTSRCWLDGSTRAPIFQRGSGRRWRWRVLYMREAQLIILDEPTASLDARAEYEVFYGLRTDAREDGRADLASVFDGQTAIEFSF